MRQYTQKHIHEALAYWRNQLHQLNESKNDNDEYTKYVVVTDGSKLKIESGWKYSDDAKDRAKELKEDGIQSKTLSRKYLVSKGIDPADDSSWFKGNVSRLSK